MSDNSSHMQNVMSSLKKTQHYSSVYLTEKKKLFIFKYDILLVSLIYSSPCVLVVLFIDLLAVIPIFILTFIFIAWKLQFKDSKKIDTQTQEERRDGYNIQKLFTKLWIKPRKYSRFKTSIDAELHNAEKVPYTKCKIEN